MTTVSEAASAYLISRETEGTAPATLRGVKSVLARFVACVGDRPTSSLVPGHVRTYADTQRGVTLRTARRQMRIVRAFCRWLVAEGYIASDPTAGVSVPRPNAAVTVPEFDSRQLRAFRLDQQRRNLAPRTIGSRAVILQAFAAHLYPTPIGEASTEEIQAWLDRCRLSPRSRGTYVGAFRSFFEYLEVAGVRTDNPARMIPRPRTKRLVPRPVPDDDLELAIRTAPPRMKAWLALASFNGFRCQEIAGLRREDLMLDNDPHLVLLSAAKGGNEAILPLHPEAERALRVFGLPDAGFVFQTSAGHPLKPNTVSSYIARYFRSLGIRASAHQARHWYGTKLFANTKDLRLTQELMRHKDPQTTAIYTAFSPSDAATAIRGLTV